MATWTNGVNEDGLRVKFATDEATTGKGGAFATAANGGLTVYEFLITGTEVPSTAAVREYDVRVPAGARIEKVEFVVETAFTSGGAATLDIGFKRASDFSTELDHNGLIAAQAIAGINTAGKAITYINGTTSAGALIGTTLANTGVLSVNYGTAAYTAGVGKLRIYTSVPYTS